MAEQQQLDIEAIKNEVTERAQQVLGQAVEFARERPHAAVGVAFGIGWVLGNGIPPRLILAAARLGWKAMLGTALATGGLAGILGDSEDSSGQSSQGESSSNDHGSMHRNESSF